MEGIRWQEFLFQCLMIFLKSVDALADNERRTRSELVREALRTYIRRSNSLNSKKAVNNAKVLDELLD